MEYITPSSVPLLPVLIEPLTQSTITDPDKLRQELKPTVRMVSPLTTRKQYEDPEPLTFGPLGRIVTPRN